MTIGSTAGGTPILRELNRVAVLDAVRQAGTEPVRIAEIARRTGLARPTVSQAVEALVGQRLLVASEPGESERVVGRPAARYALNGRTMPVLGVDVGPHRITAVVADLGGAHLAEVRHRVGRSRAPDVLATMDRAVEAALAEAGVAPRRIAAAAAGAPGLINPGSGRVELAPSVSGWEALDIVEHLRSTFSCPVRLENDANLAALAIARAHPEPVGTLLAVQWGERLGAGVVIDGRLHRGASGAAGEIGFIAGRARGRLVAEDGRGSLESRLSSTAIGALGYAEAKRRPGSRLAAYLAGPGDPARAVFAAADDQDPAALAVVDKVASAFASAIAPVVLALDPHAVVIGGGIARAGRVLADAIERRLQSHVLTAPTVALSDLAEDAVVTGAVQLALEDVWTALHVR